MGKRPLWHHFSKLPVSFLLQSSNRKRSVQSVAGTLSRSAFRRTPGTSPIPSRPWWTTFRDMWKVSRAGKAVTWRACGLRFLMWNTGGSAVGPPLCPHLSRPRERTGRGSAAFSGPWDNTHVVRELLIWGAWASLQNQEAEEAKLVPSHLPQLWI